MLLPGHQEGQQVQVLLVRLDDQVQLAHQEVLGLVVSMETNIKQPIEGHLHLVRHRRLYSFSLAVIL